MADTPSPDEPHIIRAEELRWQDFAAPPSAPAPAASAPPTSKRAIARQGTSYMAFSGEVPGADDPLLAFAPVPHKAPRRNSIGPVRQRAFIAHLAATGIVTQAARAIGASVEALYKLRRKPGAEEFDAAWNAAVDRGVARLEDTALARAIEGVDTPIVSGGKLLGTYRKHNEGLVMFLLRQRRAERYASEVRPGHPLYERIRAEVLADVARERVDGRDEEAILASIDAKLEAMRRREDEARAMIGSIS